MTRRIIKIFFFFGVMYFLPPALDAQTLQSISIKGNSIFSENTYLGWINIPKGAKLFPGILDTAESRISSALIEEGYYNFKFTGGSADTSSKGTVTLTIGIDEDSPTYIKSVNLKLTAPDDSSDVSSLLHSLSGTILSRAEMENKIGEVLNYYDNRGFPFASVKISAVNFLPDSSGENHSAEISLSINSGMKSRIDAIEIEGNKKTADYVILRELSIETGEAYSEEKISDIPARLNRLRFFGPVAEPAYYFTSDNKGVLKIKVEEKETNNFDGIIGYVPKSAGNSSGYFTGFVNINLRNLFGTGRAAAIRWQQETTSTQELELKYLEPWLFGYPFNIGLSLFQRKQDSTYVQRNLEGQIEFLASRDISASAILNSQSTIPSATSNAGAVFNSNSLSIGFSLKTDTRDDFYSPRRGILFISAYKYSSKSITGATSERVKAKNNFQRLELDFSIFHEIFSSQVAALNLHARELRGDQAEISDMYMLGGANSLRGYREKQFTGNRIFWSNLEYRYLLPGRSYVFAFFDTGYYLRNADTFRNIPEASAFNIGYGLGMNIETGLGVLAVSFALAKRDSFSDGKIHFGIINEF